MTKIKLSYARVIHEKQNKNNGLKPFLTLIDLAKTTRNITGFHDWRTLTTYVRLLFHIFYLKFICLPLEKTDFLLFTIALKQPYFSIFHTNK